MKRPHPSRGSFLVSRESLLSVLGVVYVHRKTSDGGDMYFTRDGLPLAEWLELSNWYEPDWFRARRVPLPGTGTVYRVPTKERNGEGLELVVKYCRVGEHVPLDTLTLQKHLNAEFNSPWEEFSLVTEMREGRYGPADVRIRTQDPLAIYVPPEEMQPWQHGREGYKIDRIKALHPGIDLDILRQYIMIYRWIKGENLIDLFHQINVRGELLETLLTTLTTRANGDLYKKGYVVLDMKPAHVIIEQTQVQTLRALGGPGDPLGQERQIDQVRALVKRGRYSVVDYELLSRTTRHEEQVKDTRRHAYLECQRDRLTPSTLPPHLAEVEILGVPYVYGRVESTGGQLWVMGRNGRLFDYFLPERWRKTVSWKLSQQSEVYYTVTKDNIHVVWKASRVGEKPRRRQADGRKAEALPVGFNSPFEVFALAELFNKSGIPTVYMRAIYATGSKKVEESIDLSRYESHRDILGPDGEPVLQKGHNYITIRGYYNGPDAWVCEQRGLLCRPIPLGSAANAGLVDPREVEWLLGDVQGKLRDLGYDGSFLDPTDILIILDPNGAPQKDAAGHPETRLCNLELITKKQKSRTNTETSKQVNRPTLD